MKKKTEDNGRGKKQTEFEKRRKLKTQNQKAIGEAKVNETGRRKSRRQ